MKAVIYTRVSSEEQVSNLSLDVQEKTCREYCGRNGWKVEAVYREEGESAKTANRTALRRMLEDLRTRPVDYVVVYDTSRFARDVYVHTSLKQLLSKAGAQLRAATQPLEDTAAGRAIEGVFAVFNQLDNELRAEKITAGMRETITRGFWPWPAPLGYRNDRTAEGRKIIVHDGEKAVLMRQGFEAIAAGEAPADVLRRLTALGLLSKKGRPVRYQEFRKFLRNPLYKGVTRSDRWGIETKGQHEPLVDAITWSRVQQRLDGRYGKMVQPPRRKENPEFPLRGFVRCAVCQGPLTASNSRGKLGKTYPYYRCWRKGCGKTQVRAEKLEQSFSDLLRGAEVSPGTMRLVKETLLDMWQELRTDSGQQTATAKRRITELERRKQRLVQAYVYDQAIDRPTYDKELAALDESLTLANLELQDAQMEDLDLEVALDTASVLLTSTSSVWETASAPKKRSLQPLLFPEGVTFDGKAIGTPATAFVFSTLGQKQAGIEDLVDQGKIETLPVPVRPPASFGVAGNRVLFGAEPQKAGAGSDGWYGMNLWSVDADGGNPRRLTRGRKVLRAVWSEPAGLIAYWTKEMEIRVMRPDGSDDRLLASPGASPAFSPDGTRIAYARLPEEWQPGALPGGFDLHVIDLATGADRELTSGYDDAEPIWTPDGSALLFLSGGRTGLTSFWRITPDGRELTQLTNAGQSRMTEQAVKNPSANLETEWSPDGSMLLYGARYSDAGEVVVLDFDRSWAVREARELGAGRSPAWTAQGTVQVIREGAQGPQALELPVRGQGVLKTLEVAPAPVSSLEIRPGRGVEFLAGAVELEVDKHHTNPPRYRFPLSYHPAGSRYYYDNDTSAGAVSWKCNGETYNGHRGSDFPAPCGTSIYAGHGGSVIARNDGCPNVGFWGSTCGGGFGNYVRLDNGFSWYSIYAHMQSGTPIGFVGVACGQYIGTSYTSGNSTGCHLHFEVQHYGYPSDDPYGGSCSGPESFWCNQNGDGVGFPSRACC